MSPVANIARRPDGRWRARYRDDAGKEHARHFARKVDAQRWLDEVTASRLTGAYVDPKAGRATFASYFADWATRQLRRRVPPSLLSCRSMGSSSLTGRLQR